MRAVEQIITESVRERVEVLQSQLREVKINIQTIKGNTDNIINDLANETFKEFSTDGFYVTYDKCCGLKFNHDLFKGGFDESFFTADIFGYEEEPMKFRVNFSTWDFKAYEVEELSTYLNLFAYASKNIDLCIPRFKLFKDSLTGIKRNEASVLSDYDIKRGELIKEIDEVIEQAVNTFKYETGMIIESMRNAARLGDRNDLVPTFKKMAIKNVQIQFLNQNGGVVKEFEISKVDFFRNVIWNVKRELGV